MHGKGIVVMEDNVYDHMLGDIDAKWMPTLEISVAKTLARDCGCKEYVGCLLGAEARYEV